MNLKPLVKTIYLSSLTLRERALLRERISSVKISSKKQELLKGHWSRNVGEASTRYFDHRLLWSEIDKQDIPILLGTITEFDFNHHQLPNWTKKLELFLNRNNSESLNSTLKNIQLNYKDKVPFVDVLLPIVNYFLEQTNYENKILTKEAYSNLCLNLIYELSNLSSQCFLEDMMDNGLDYSSFVEETQRDNYKNFFAKYPSLVRIIFTRGDFWVKNSNELIEDTLKNRTALSKKLSENEGSFMISKISNGTSETHNKGRGVYVMETKQRNKFVYKQRSILNDKQFYSLVEKLEEKLDVNFYIPWVLSIGDKGGYMEFVEHRSVQTQKEVKDFYKSVGSYLCIFYILGSTDMHSENMIASGKDPVFIDLETIFGPRIKLNHEYLNKLDEFISEKFGKSVSASGVLPQWILGPDTQVYNKSAIGGDKKGARHPRLVWKEVNTDQMHFYYDEKSPEEDKNILYEEDSKVESEKYLNDILLGFTYTYKTLKNDDTLPDELDKFTSIKTRFVFRPTKTYTILLDYLKHPEYMKSGVERSIEMEILAKGMLMSLDKKHIFWDVYEDELRQLEDHDVPYYFTEPDKEYLASNKGILYSNAFKSLGLESAKEKFSKLNENDLNFQKKIIANSINTSKITNNVEKRQSKNVYLDVNNKSVLNTVEIIADKIIQEKITVDNRTTWVSYVSNIVSHTFGYKPIGTDLTNGNMGVALFFAALYKHTNKDLYKEIVLETTKPMEDILNNEWSKKEFLLRFGTGGTSGLGSLIYGFCKIHEYTNENRYLKLAETAFEMLNKKAIDQSIREDVVSGNAGLLLSLLKFYELKKSKSTVKFMKYIVEKLLNKGFEDTEFVNWEYQQDKVLLGFSHGSSGILYSLSRYLDETEVDENRLLEKIEKIIRYESENYSENVNNWPDFRPEVPDCNIVSWCHGAVGIGMSRLALLENTKINNVENTINQAFKKMYETGIHPLDTLCCGNSGRLDFLLELKNSKLQNSKNDVYTQKIVSHLIHSFENEELKYFSKFDTPDLNVGLFHGLSGLGYQLLRYLDPKNIDSILLFK